MRCVICDAPDAEFPDPLEPNSATRELCFNCYRDGAADDSSHW